MDALEADADVKLYKASDKLLQELRAKLPLLVRPKNAAQSHIRRRVLWGKDDDLIKLLDAFQGWPQLLDPYLAELISVLTTAFLAYALIHRDNYHDYVEGTIPLPRAVCRLLYTFCKVRGRKVIVRLLQNEPKYVEPMVVCFNSWSKTKSDTNKALHMTWEEHYILLLWLSHLMLAPFELSSISSLHYQSNDRPEGLYEGLPDVSRVLLSLAFAHLYESSKAQESAAQLAVRLALRRDMQALKLPERLVQHSLLDLTKSSAVQGGSAYRHLGNLQLLYGLMNSGSDHELVSVLDQTFRSCITIATTEDSTCSDVRNSAPARKLLVKIIRSIVIHALVLSNNVPLQSQLDVGSMLEDSIQYYLDALGDRDTPVRMAASKALSMVTLKLNSSMAAEVVEAILGSLQENILVEDSASKILLPLNQVSEQHTKHFRQNLSAVDPLKWHGLMLTLGHLLFRRSLPLELLQGVVEALLFGLEFEQRSNVGTSVGVAVRDAANFGIWAIARKYTTDELNSIVIAFHGTDDIIFQSQHLQQPTLQLLATRLVVSACLDPSGNIRRGSSAALQELIGRHPDTILAGIPLVQTVDYHDIARRSRAMMEVTMSASKLDTVYRYALLHALLSWRGVGAVDTESRRWATMSVQDLSSSISETENRELSSLVKLQLKGLKPTNIGRTAATRHGLMLGLSAILSASCEDQKAVQVQGEVLVPELPEITGDLLGRFSADLELVVEAYAKLVQVLLKSIGHAGDLEETTHTLLLQTVFPILDRCTAVVTQDDIVAEVAAANLGLFQFLSEAHQSRLLDEWLFAKQQRASVQTGKARITSLGYLLHWIWTAQHAQLEEKADLILSHLTSFLQGSYSIETKVDAIRALREALSSSHGTSDETRAAILDTLLLGLSDYTNDQRGDIGSLLRLESIATFEIFWIHCYSEKTHDSLHPAIAQIVGLAIEKLNKVRFRAWQLLKQFWEHSDGWPRIVHPCLQPEDVSADIYFAQMATLMEVEWLRHAVVTGFISSTTGGTDQIGRASLAGLVSYLSRQDEDSQSSMMEVVSTVIYQRLLSTASAEDRDIIPVLDFATILIEQNLLQPHPSTPFTNLDNAFWDVLQRLHGPSSSVQRVEACVRLYAALSYSSTPTKKTRALDRLTRMLLHRWPKVRQAAADALYLCTSSEMLVACDWNAPVGDIKPTVVALRRDLGVAGTKS